MIRRSLSAPRHRILGLALVMASVFASPSLMHAQAETADLVRLNDGRMIRGVIVELVPGDYVIVQAVTGELQRYAMDDVDYAGPAASASPPAAKAPPNVTAPPGGPESPEGALRVRVTSDQPGLTLHRTSGVSYGGRYGGPGGPSFAHYAYGRLCTAPCEFTIDPGFYGFTVEDLRRRRAHARGSIILRTDATLHISYSDRRPQRIVRWLVASALTLGGSAMMIAAPVVGRCTSYSYTGDDCYSRGVHIPLLSAGAGILAGGLVTTIIAAATRDRGKVTVTSYDAAQP
jgi:hypothetical protein